MQKAPITRGFLCSLLQEELTKEQHPEKIQITEDDTSGEGGDQAHHKTEQTALLVPSGPSYNNLSYPVNKGDDEEQKLNKTILLIEPSH
jgi:hypothetical protein